LRVARAATFYVPDVATLFTDKNAAHDANAPHNSGSSAQRTEQRACLGERRRLLPLIPTATGRTRTRTRTRTNTNPNDTKASAAGRRGARMRSANGTCKNQGAWGSKCLTKRETLLGGVHSGNAHRKAPDLRNTKFRYSRGQNRLFQRTGRLVLCLRNSNSNSN
jgi:hypothetical protein